MLVKAAKTNLSIIRFQRDKYDTIIKLRTHLSDSGNVGDEQANDSFYVEAANMQAAYLLESGYRCIWALVTPVVLVKIQIQILICFENK